MKKFISVVTCTAMCTSAFAENIQLNSIAVNGSDMTSNSNSSKSITKVQQRRVLQDAIEKTEVINKKEIAQSQSQTLSETIEKQAGVNVETGCSAGILVSASTHDQDQVDRNHNGVSESPSMKNQVISIMLTHKFSPHDTINVRAAHFSSDVKGGTMVSQNSAIAQGATSDNFAGGNVNNAYLGSPMNMLETINTTRDELYAKEHHILNDVMSLQTTLAYSEQIK